MQALAEIEPLKSLQVQEYLNVPPERIEQVEAKLLQLPQAKFADDYPLEHHFSPGVYIRKIFMPAGDLVLGHAHLTHHANLILQGRAAVMMDGKLHDLRAGTVINSDAGVRKVLYILEDCIWATVHSNPDNITDVPQLEDRLRVKSKAYQLFEAEKRQIQDFMNNCIAEVYA